MDKMDGLSLDLEKENINKIKELFPEAVEEGKINFDMLRAFLGDEIDDSREKYQFTWNGKAKSIKLAQTPSSATLRPCKEKSKNWDTTENLYIEGDNLEVLKQLQKTYYGKIKMIYIDPPYNTGNDFVYNDSFSNSIENYKEQTSQASSSNPETNGRFHTDWLNMMYPRLILAKNLLSDDGVIFISMDDNEVENLKKICDEIFGEYNFVTRYLWTKTSTPPSLSYKYRKTVEYILCYEKRLNNSSYFGSLLSGGDAPLLNAGNPEKELAFPAKSVHFNFIENGNLTCGRYDRVELMDEVNIINGINDNIFRMKGSFKWVQDTLNEEVAKGTYFICKTSKMSIRFQRPFDENNFKAPNNFLDVELNKTNAIGTNESAVKELEDLGFSHIFDFAKPVSLVEYLSKMITKFDNDSYILDFFSGSATTAHAIMKLNAEDGGNRKFIMVQLPELCDEEKEAYKAGYKNICDIGEERIRRAGEQIKYEWGKEHPSDGLFASEETFNTDIGFKVFELDSSNVNEWDPNLELEEKELAMRLKEVFKSDRSNEDILYEILLKYGVFDKQVEEIEVNGKTMYRVGKRYMIVCLDNNVTNDDVKAIGELSPRTVIFKESGFIDDNAKINAVYNLEKVGVEDVKSI